MANIDAAARPYAAPNLAAKTNLVAKPNLALKTAVATKPSDKPDDQPSGPRRGAFPTPKEIIEKAKPFVAGAPPPVPPKAPKPESK